MSVLKALDRNCSAPPMRSEKRSVPKGSSEGCSCCCCCSGMGGKGEKGILEGGWMPSRSARVMR